MFNKIIEQETICKCCDSKALLWDVIDFNKYCNLQKSDYIFSGIPIYYFRCQNCKFIFTKFTDNWNNDIFKKYIYNDDYIKFDPEYINIRPKRSANFLRGLFCGNCPSILDFGSGEGQLAKFLRFPDMEAYDPFNPKYVNLPNKQFDCIVSIEVLEHLPNPLFELQQMKKCLIENGIILFTTLFQPPDINIQRLQWWYASPRNGHISLYTKESLIHLGDKINMKYKSLDNNSIHVYYGEVPQFARHFI